MMKFRNYLQEKYCARYEDVEIYSNPTKKELVLISKMIPSDVSPGYGSGSVWASDRKDEIRFFADDRIKKVFCWPAYQEIHTPIARKLISMGEMKFFREDTPEILWGVAYWHGNRGMIVSSDELENAVSRQSEYAKKQLSIDWDWVKPYFDISYLDNLRKQINKKRVKGMIVDEEYKLGFKMPGNIGYCEVFSNPGSKEIQEFYGKYIRFAIIKKSSVEETLYIWNGDIATHDKVANELGCGLPDILLSGVATVELRKLRYDTGYDLFYTDERHVYERIQKFKPYFSNFSILLSDLKKQLWVFLRPR